MAWIESHQELEKHPKVLMLMSLMGWSKDTTIGKLHRFWWWCVSYAEDGDLRKYHVDQIGAAVDLAPGKESSLFANNMVKAKWIDPKPYLRVHDWWHYIGRFLQVKYKLHPEKWGKVRALYTDSSNNPPNNGDNNHIPNLTKPNLTKPKKKQPYWAAFKKNIQEQMKVISKGFNIYQFLTKFKIDKNIELPEEVIKRICAGYLKNRPTKTDWGWFVVVTQKEWEFWNAEKSMLEGQQWKNTPVVPAIKEILASIARDKK